MQVFEGAAARVIVPVVIDGPQMILGQHALQTLDGWNRRPGAGLRIKPVCTAASTLVTMLRFCRPGAVLKPITRSDVLVWSGHFDPTPTRRTGGLSRGG